MNVTSCSVLLFPLPAFASAARPTLLVLIYRIGVVYLSSYAELRSLTTLASISLHVPPPPLPTVVLLLLLPQVQEKQQEWLAAGADHTASCRDFMQQLAYREYSRYLSFHFPFMHERPLLSHLRCVPWNLDQVAFKVRTCKA